MSDPAHAYAFAKLGYIVTEANADRFTPEELAAWDQAVDEWREQHPDDYPEDDDDQE